MITRLFRTRPKLDSRTPEDRRAAIEALSEAEAAKVQTDLIRLAEGDDDDGVRKAALSKLQDEEALRSLLEDETQAERVVARVLELNEQGECQALADTPMILAAQLPQASDPEALAGRLVALGGHALLIDALLKCDRDRRESLLTLAQLKNLQALQELERRSRDRDKKTNRFARAGLEELRQQTAQANSLVEVLEERLANLEKTSEVPSPQDQERRAVVLGRIEQSLAELKALTALLTSAGAQAPSADGFESRYQQLLAQPVKASVPEAPESPEPAEQRRKTDPAGSQTASTAADFDSLTAGFLALDQALATSTDFEALAEERQALTEQWLASADHAPPADAQHRVFESVSHRFQMLADAHKRLASVEFEPIDHSRIPEELTADTDPSAWRAAESVGRAERALRKSLKHINWPEWAALPEVLAAQLSAAEAAGKRLELWQQLLERTTTEITQALEALDALIDAGELKSARAEAGRIRKRLKPLPERSVTELTRHLGRASARLSELSDWQTFATTPKREALVAAMTEIAGNPLSPPDQASRIKALRGEWNALGPVGRADDHKLLDAFNEMAEKAFEPCRSHFAEQAEVRAANLAAREAICTSLDEYLAATDWAGADYKAAERIMRTARDEWRAHHPVDRNAGKALETRFEALQADLHQHIKAEWDRNLTLKRQIVEEAQALIESEQPVAEQVEAAKRLQQRWKTVGSTPRRPDQTLWKAFRSACDAIFENRDSAKRSEDEEIQGNRQQAEQLLSDFRKRLDDAANPIEPASLRDFQDQYSALPRLPERLGRALEKERDELVRIAQQTLREQRTQEARARLQNLQAQDAEVSALEQRQLAGESIEFSPPDPVFANRCQPDAAPVAEEVLTRLVIEAEIAAGLESEEADLRMALQVEMMNSGRSQEALSATPDELTRRWCELGPKETSADNLRTRFFAAITALLQR